MAKRTKRARTRKRKSSPKRRQLRQQNRSNKMARSKRRSSRSRTILGGMTPNVKRVVGSVSYAVLGEPLLDQITNRFNLGLGDELIKGVAGFIIANNTTGIIKSMADSAVSIAAYKFGGEQIGDVLQRFTGQSTNNKTITTSANNSNNGATF